MDFKKWFKKAEPDVSKVDIEDRNKKEAEAIKKFKPMFHEFEEKARKEIMDFYRNYKEPSDEIKTFVSKIGLSLVVESQLLSTFEWAKNFADMDAKYRTCVVSQKAINDFSNAMYKEYRQSVSVYNIDFSITPEMAQAMKDWVEIIDINDVPLLIHYREKHYGHICRFMDDHRSLVIDKLPKDLKFGEKFTIDDDIKTILKNTGNYDLNTNLIDSISFGVFKAVTMQQDPFILATLKNKLYIVVDHINEIPKVNDFLV